MSQAPFQNWTTMSRFIKASVEANDDIVIIIDGVEGSGKSTLAFHLCRWLQPDWSAADSLVIDYSDWMNVYDDGDGKRILLLDEGGNLLFSRDAMTNENKHLVQVMQMNRIMNNVLIICCPNQRWLDVFVREHRAMIYIQVHKEYDNGKPVRGRATVRYRKRWFDGRSGETMSRWITAYELLFPSVDETSHEWIEYVDLKKSKIINHGLDLEMAAMAKRAR